MSNVDNYFQTIIRLKPSQIFYRLYYRIIPRRFFIENNYNYILPNKKFEKPISKLSIIYEKNSYQFCFLNIKKKLRDFDMDELGFPKLWIYNLYYFDYLIDLDNLNTNLNFKINLMHKWINFSNKKIYSYSLDPYPTSLRIVNWIKLIILNKVTDKIIIQSLYSQVSLLNRSIEYHILGNHLIANAKALVFGGLFFNNKISKKWLQKGIKILKAQIVEQILNDGGHFEQSPMYHNIIFEDFLDIINILKSYERYDLIEKIKIIHCLRKINQFSSLMNHPDGDVSFFNDSSTGIASTNFEINKYLKRLNIKNNKSEKLKFYDLTDSGYSILSNKIFYLIFDRGNIQSKYQPGHSHSDILSFELSFLKTRFLVNSGINTYENNQARILQRSSISHNSLTIGNLNATQVWHSFRVGKRAKIIKRKNYIHKDFIILSGTHDGYLNTKYKATHTRNIKLTNNIFTISDFVIGNGKMEVNIYFHFYNELNYRNNDNYHLITNINGYKIDIISDKTSNCTVEKQYYFPTFGVKKIKSTLIINKIINNKKLFNTKFIFTKIHA